MSVGSSLRRMGSSKSKDTSHMSCPATTPKTNDCLNSPLLPAELFLKTPTTISSQAYPIKQSGHQRIRAQPYGKAMTHTNTYSHKLVTCDSFLGDKLVCGDCHGIGYIQLSAWVGVIDWNWCCESVYNVICSKHLCTLQFTGILSGREQRHRCTKIHLFETISKWHFLYCRNTVKMKFTDEACIVDFCPAEQCYLFAIWNTTNASIS